MQDKKSRVKKNRWELGQSLVELALSGLLLALLFSGIVDIARIYFTYIALEDSAGEAVLYLSTDPECVDDTPAECSSTYNATWRGQNAAGGQLDWSGATFTFDPSDPSGLTVGETVSVTIEYPYNFITPLMGTIFESNSITLSVFAEQVVVSES